LYAPVLSPPITLLSRSLQRPTDNLLPLPRQRDFPLGVAAGGHRNKGLRTANEGEARPNLPTRSSGKGSGPVSAHQRWYTSSIRPTSPSSSKGKSAARGMSRNGDTLRGALSEAAGSDIC